MRGPKVNPNMVGRFTGKNGRTRLIDVLLRQNLILGNASLARRIANLAQVITVRSNREITKQGGNDNDLYLVLGGTISHIYY